MLSYTIEQRLRDDYAAHKERLQRDNIPFVSYLHERGWMFLRLDEVCEKEGSIGSKRGYETDRDYAKRLEGLRPHTVSPKGRKDFDRIVARLRKIGTLLDVTEYVAEGR